MYGITALVTAIQGQIRFSGCSYMRVVPGAHTHSCWVAGQNFQYTHHNEGIIERLEKCNLIACVEGQKKETKCLYKIMPIPHNQWPHKMFLCNALLHDICSALYKNKYAYLTLCWRGEIMWLTILHTTYIHRGVGPLDVIKTVAQYGILCKIKNVIRDSLCTVKMTRMSLDDNLSFYWFCYNHLC